MGPGGRQRTIRPSSGLLAFVVVGLLLAGCGAAPSVVRTNVVEAVSLPHTEHLNWKFYPYDVACPAPSECVAISSSNGVASDFFLSQEVHGVWQPAQILRPAAALPATRYEGNGGDAISCWAPRDCMIVVTVSDLDNVSAYRSVAYTLHDGVLSHPRPLPGESFSPSRSSGGVSRLRCSANGCVAAGDWFANDYSSLDQPFFVSERHGRWSLPQVVAVSTATQSNAVTTPSIVVGLSCTRSLECEAVVNASRPKGDTIVEVLSNDGGRWYVGSHLLNVGLGGSATAFDCGWSLTDCALGGSLPSGKSNTQAFVMSQREGLWGPALPVAFARGWRHTLYDSGIETVACPTRGDCAAAGSVSCASKGMCRLGSPLYFGVAQDTRGWTKGTVFGGETHLWDPSEGPIPGYPTTMACSTRGNCVVGFGANGDTQSSSGQVDEPPLIVELHAGKWGSINGLRSSPDLPSFGNPEVNGSACVPSGQCTLVGIAIVDSAGDPDGFVYQRRFS